MEDRISIRGRTARKMVKVANHLPLPGGQSQAGQLRAKLYQRERMWECPEHLSHSVITMEHFTMELLSRKRETEDTENNTDDWELPGIVLQLILIPAIMVLLDRTKLVRFVHDTPSAASTAL